MARRTSLKEIKELEEEYLVPVVMLLPITVEKQLKTAVEQTELQHQLTHKPIHIRRDEAFKVWLNSTKEGHEALFLAHKKLLNESEKRVKAWLLEQFLVIFPAYRARMGRPLGVAPHRKRKITTGKIVTEALLPYFKKQRKLNEEK